MVLLLSVFLIENGSKKQVDRPVITFNVPFQELRRLFALMVASQRKYVDPSRAVDILRGSIGTNGSSAGPANLNNSLGGLSNLVTNQCTSENNEKC